MTFHSKKKLRLHVLPKSHSLLSPYADQLHLLHYSAHTQTKAKRYQPEQLKPLKIATTSLSMPLLNRHWWKTFEQLHGDKWAYFSKSMHKAESRYRTSNHELLAIYLAIKHSCYFLEGHFFTTCMNHKPLTFTLTDTNDT